MNCDFVLDRTAATTEGIAVYCWKCSKCGTTRNTRSNSLPSHPCRANGPVKAAVGFVTSVLCFAASGTGFASQNVVTERLKICQACDLFDPDGNRCKHCGCNVGGFSGKFLDDLRNKLAHPKQSCPIGKWRAVR